MEATAQAVPAAGAVDEGQLRKNMRVVVYV